MVSGRTTGRRSFAMARSNTGLLAPCDGPARCRTPLTLMPRSVPREDLCPCSTTGTARSSGHQTRQVVYKQILHVWASEPAGAMACSSPARTRDTSRGAGDASQEEADEGRGWSAKVNGGVKPYPNVCGWH